MKQEIRQKIFSIERDVLLIKKLQEMQKTLLSSGAYSIKNMERQSVQFDNANVPQWERDIVTRMWNVKSRYSHKLFRDIDLLLNEMEKDLNES